MQVAPSCLHSEVDETPPLEEALANLRAWDKLPKEKLLESFEQAHFAGIEEIKQNDKLFQRLAPMAVADLVMAMTYESTPCQLLPVPIVAFDGTLDTTIPRGESKHARCCTVWRMPCQQNQ